MKGSECKFVKYMEGSDKRFVIPVYQRNYDWKTENCKQLYDDLVKIIKGDIASAKDYLADTFGISRTSMRSTKAIMEQAAANGIEFEGLE